MRDPAAGIFKSLSAAIVAGDDLTVSLLYGDFEGRQRVITQFAVRRGNNRWPTSASRHFNIDRPDPC